MPGQNKTKGLKLLIAKKARIRAWREEKTTRTAVADNVGCQKSIQLAQGTLCPGGSLASSRVRET
jgi:hypothetical protein